ncbi:MAG: RDD family protein, partial [Gammaproteobacteria bacterium]
MNKPCPITTAKPGVFRRLAALLYDSIVVIAIAFTATNIYLMVYHASVGLAPHALDPTFLQTTLFPLIVLASVAFFTWFWTHGGRTLGMRAWH